MWQVSPFKPALSRVTLLTFLGQLFDYCLSMSHVRSPKQEEARTVRLVSGIAFKIEPLRFSLRYQPLRLNYVDVKPCTT